MIKKPNHYQKVYYLCSKNYEINYPSIIQIRARRFMCGYDKKWKFNLFSSRKLALKARQEITNILKNSK